jgi:hypothetical protein
MFNVRATQGTTTPPQLRINGLSIANAQAQIEVDLLSGTTPATWSLQSKASIEQSWTTHTTSVETISPTRFRFSIPAGTAENRQFYRIQAN